MIQRLIPISLTLPLSAVMMSAQAQQPSSLAKQAGWILAERCIKCHYSEKKSGDIDLSTRTAALKEGAFMPNDPAMSRLVTAVASGRMPPSGKLPKADASLLASWVKAGAAWPKEPIEPGDSALKPTQKPLWSFQRIRKPTIPESPFDKLSANPMDRFLFARLHKEGLRPNPLASKRDLLRRVTIDLTGLPPTWQEMQSFLKDPSPSAYERVVDRLLNSPAYGERWGRSWLDVVRFGESHGYEQNHLRPNAWPYRDYVINSLNADKPFDRFIKEQIAADVLAKEDSGAQAATGFLVAGIHDTVGIQEEMGRRQQRINDLEDMVATTGAAFLGLTVGCARCHDHKFDPVTQRDFYQLAACFAGVQHGDRAVRPLTPAEQTQAKELERRVAEISELVNALDATGRGRVLKSRGQAASTRPAVSARFNEDRFPPVRAKFVRFTILRTNDGAEPCIDELRIFGPGSTSNLAATSVGAKARSSSVLPGFAIHQTAHLNDGQLGNEHSWISNERGAGWAEIELPDATFVDRITWSRDGAEIPRFDDRLPVAYRIEVSADRNTWKAVSTDEGRAGTNDYVHPDAIQAALTQDERDSRKALSSERDKVRVYLERLRNSTVIYAGTFAPPEATFLLRRGDVAQRLDEVLPSGLAELSGPNTASFSEGMQNESSRRVALANWLADPNNPLTPRVIVNRIWQGHFGKGLVGTPSDFGRNGEPPTHPELLDWLASVFISFEADCCGEMDSMGMDGPSSKTKSAKSAIAPVPGMQWKLKALHRLLVTSYAYKQSSISTAEGMKRDGGNRWLWRMPLRRMEAEMVRDAVLQVSGKLDRRMGGPGFRLFQYNVVNVAIYNRLEDQGPETWRRSVYQQAARGIRDDILGTLDCPESSQRAPKRESTTTALQALSLLNSKFMGQQAQFLAEKAKSEFGRTVATITAAYRSALNREPTVDEFKMASGLVGSGSIAALCRALLNSNEFLYY